MTEVKFYGHGLPNVENLSLPGKLIVLEGPDGVGRSTQVALLREWLEAQGYAVFTSTLPWRSFMRPISATVWSARSSPCCAQVLWCSPIATSIR